MRSTLAQRCLAHPAVVIALARARPKRWDCTAADLAHRRRAAGFVLAALLATSIATQAKAEIGASLSVLSDDRYRGRSLSDERPVATFDLSYDHRSGAYAGISLTGVATSASGVQFLALREYVGFSHQLRPGLTADIGISDKNYTRYSSYADSYRYTEFYVGLQSKHVLSRLYISPSYLDHGATAYGELEAIAQPWLKWRLNGHVGLLASLGPGPLGDPAPTQYDWRVGIGRRIRAIDLSLTLTGAGPKADYYAVQPQKGRAVVVGAAWIF